MNIVLLHQTWFTQLRDLYRSSLTKVFGPVILDLVAMGWNTSFTILFEHLPPQL
jgi:hypothetical protein